MLKMAGLFLVTTFVGTIHAKAAWQSGNGLYQYCTAQQEMLCYGYVEGILDMTLFAEETMRLRYSICTPQGVTSRELVDVVVKYLKNNPEKRHFTAAGEVWGALSEAFPCAKN
jgi:hypothetical protein